MSETAYSIEEIARRGQALYDEQIRSKVEPAHRGEYLILNVDTGEYEIDQDDLVASQRARARFADAPLFTIRVGHPTAYRLGAAPNIRES